jgi:hypothetical protein
MRFHHSFPVVQEVESQVETSQNSLPFLEFDAQFYMLRPVEIVTWEDGHQTMLLEHDAFPGELVGELRPDPYQPLESPLGTSCQLVIVAKLHKYSIYIKPGYFAKTDYILAALWIEWKSGVAYRRGFAAILGPRSRDSGMPPEIIPESKLRRKEGVDLLKEILPKIVNVKLS